MISKHSHEQSDRGEGVEVVQNEPFEDPHHGNGQFTEKRVYLNSKLPSWARAVVPKIFYVTEKAWNYYPYTITEYTCSFLPKFSIHIETKYEDNKGSNDSIFDNEAKDLEREVCFIDIACDEIPERYYKESEDPKHFKSEKTGRGQLREGWRDSHQPIMCSYKLVTVKFEVWGLQTRVEQFVHKVQGIDRTWAPDNNRPWSKSETEECPDLLLSSRIHSAQPKVEARWSEIFF
uniref:Cytoplasmic phosphatidylinositol transfer protein 1 isoform X3 n=1 Tax=Camelus bactrianus TaxID=9837 RepID=A0A9W3HDI4_CAMBA|nr:cytoplasmic phosphatidylinositol transfer protein 1 isoform X3 [Camelus bactrianus]XP_045367908.1 cytoplasmic phosphatidylinositol transfer protein 1 isoform X3 [Camelus bactrianus]